MVTDDDNDEESTKHEVLERNPEGLSFVGVANEQDVGEDGRHYAVVTETKWMESDVNRIKNLDSERSIIEYHTNDSGWPG